MKGKEGIYLSEILLELKIKHICENEKPIKSLGLIKYHDNFDVCTFIESNDFVDDISSEICMVITKQNLVGQIKNKNVGICVVENPRLTFFKIHNFLSERNYFVKKIFDTKIGANCLISPLASISAQNVVIGDNVVVDDFVVIKNNTIIGNNSIIGANSVIGGQGFEFKKEGDFVFRINHVGGVVIGNNVELQNMVCIDKAIYSWDNTIINDFVKIDNLIHIGHGVKIGKRTECSAGSILGGRVLIGEDAWIGINSTVRNGITIGNQARVNMGAVVTQNVFDNEGVSGNFAVKHEDFIRKIKGEKWI